TTSNCGTGGKSRPTSTGSPPVSRATTRNTSSCSPATTVLTTSRSRDRTEIRPARCRSAIAPSGLWVGEQRSDPVRGGDHDEVHADQAGYGRVGREDDGDALRGHAGDDRPLHRRTDPGRRSGRGRGSGRPEPGGGGRLSGRDSGGHRRPVRRNQGAVR